MQLPQCGQSRPHRLDSNDTSGFHCAVRWRWRGGGEDCRDLARYLVQTFWGVENAPIHQIKDNLVSLFFPRRGDLWPGAHWRVHLWHSARGHDCLDRGMGTWFCHAVGLPGAKLIWKVDFFYWFPSKCVSFEVPPNKQVKWRGWQEDARIETY